VRARAALVGRASACARGRSKATRRSLATLRATRPARSTGKRRDERTEGDSLDQAAIKRVRSYLVKLSKISEVKAVIEEMAGTKLGDDFSVKSDATVKSCIAGRVPWRPSGDEMSDDASGDERRARPFALRQAEIRLYCAYHR
jgi:hypothetical protein